METVGGKRMAEAESIISAFKALPTNEARRSVLQSILAELKPGEWRELRDQTNERTFQYDIFGSLPLELAAHVCSYLDPVEVISARRVSKRWNERMSVPFNGDAAFSRSCPGETLPDISDPQWKTCFLQHVKRRHAKETGRPYSAALYEVTNYYGVEFNTFTYCSGKLAWHNEEVIRVLCLKTGKLSRFTTEHRFFIQEIRLSEFMVAAISSRSSCHVWNLRDGQTLSFRLPSLNIDKFDIFQHRVVIHFAAGSFLFWDYKTQVTLETTFTEGPDAIVFHRSTNSFTAVYTKKATCGMNSDVVVSRFSVLGTSIQQSASSVLIPGDGIRRFEISNPRSLIPDLLMIFQWSDTTANGQSFREVLVDFTSSIDDPSIHVSSAVDKDAFPMGSLHSPSSITPISETLIYQIRKKHMNPDHQVAPEIFLYDFRRSESFLTEIGGIEREASSGEGRSAGACDHRGSIRLLGDDEFLCLVSERDETVTAFCFDENVSMAGELPRYRYIRNRRAAERAQLRRKSAEKED